jgi:predicted dinucleotide-binding enzyme
MKLGVLGTGMVGKAIASRLVELGHEVTMGSRSADGAAVTEWATAHGELAHAGTFADAAGYGDIVFNCTKGEIALDALQLAGAEALRGRVLVDVSNPLVFSGEGLPTLSVKDTDSLGEQIQRAYPDTHVVKALNTMNCGVMVHPDDISGDHCVFVCGNDASAKASVTALLLEFGWSMEQIVDLGDISAARGTEMFLPLWLRIMRAKGSANFNIAVLS